MKCTSRDLTGKGKLLLFILFLNYQIIVKKKKEA